MKLHLLPTELPEVKVLEHELFEDEREAIFTYAIVVMPLAGAFIGLLVWLARRR